MIKSVGGGKYVVVSHTTGKTLTKPASKPATEKKLANMKRFSKK